MSIECGARVRGMAARTPSEGSYGVNLYTIIGVVLLIIVVILLLRLV